MMSNTENNKTAESGYQKIVMYPYKELSDEAKAKVREWYIRDDENYNHECFEKACDNVLNSCFPNSVLHATFDKNLQVYGTICINDVLALLLSETNANGVSFHKYVISSSEADTVKEYVPKCGYTVDVVFHSVCGHDVPCGTDFAEEWINKLKATDGISEKGEDAVRNLERIINSMLSDLEMAFSWTGYGALNNPPETSIIRDAEENGWMFLENGAFCGCRDSILRRARL